MNAQTLPQTYYGFSTAELLDILERIPGGQAKDVPMSTMSVLNDLVMEYGLTPVARGAIARKKARESQQSLT
jgi:hypothetical protein